MSKVGKYGLIILTMSIQTLEEALEERNLVNKEQIHLQSSFR